MTCLIAFLKNEVLAEASRRGATSSEVQEMSMQWIKDAQLMRYPEAVEKAINSLSISSSAKNEKLKQWRECAYSVSHSEAKQIASRLGVECYFDWEAPRSREGYYRIKGGLDYSIMRGLVCISCLGVVQGIKVIFVLNYIHIGIRTIL